ncbi:MAG: cytochrome c family protein [Planctomycetes bacterium]|nr:cytochrome c family protein [Planctomycetota bacterium]
MKGGVARRTTVLLTGVGLSLGIGISWARVSGDPGEPAGKGGKFSYVGATACKKCHLKEHKSWEKTKMAHAIETLKPGQAVEMKKKFKLDPEKDYTQDASCLACHTTGYGEEGGYAVPAAGDDKAAKKAEKLAGVGCESCHGPGSEYVKIFEDIQKTERKYKVEELYSAGLKKMDAGACTNCHNDKGPTFDPAKPFDFEKQKTQDAHEVQPLKQRE